MKIGVMLRHLDQHGGGVLQYTKTIARSLLAMDQTNEYVLMYRNPKYLGTYADGERVRELCVRSPSTLLWDQVAVPWMERKERPDVIFNPKFSLPLFAGARSVFVCHGLDWYVMPWGSRWHDRLSHRYLVPRYAKMADAIIAVSETARRHAIQYWRVPEDKIHTIYLGIDPNFSEPVPEHELERVRDRYGLPARFFLFAGQIFPNKNFGRLIEAYARVGPQLGVPLVVAGTHTFGSEREIALIDELGISKWVKQLGWIDRGVLPSLYRLAHAVLFPSLYEACPSPILEAFATETPLLTSSVYGTGELAADGAVLVDPEDIDDISAGIRTVATDGEVRNRIIEAGRQRLRDFDWNQCARKTLEVLESVCEHREPSLLATR
ncbi:MAG TPA: glycosyltransferase family 1 protein [Gammaproteobacteria bacterium]|nr:glycosyltransferase family 1 protein [Gammaproteobacteria bacterium]